jgi:surface protein
MNGMFQSSKLTGDISKWDVSNVDTMSWMFCESKFNKDISNWNIKKVIRKGDMFYKCPIKEEYKPKFNVSESFAFDVINKRKKPINLYNTQIMKILKAIENREELSDKDYEILTQYTGIYKQTDKDELHSLIDYFTD